MATSFGIIGVGAFGELAAQHLAPHFDLVLHDAHRDLLPVVNSYGGRIGNLVEAASCDILMLAIPIQRFEQVLTDIAPVVKADAIVIDVASIKSKPIELMQDILPPTVQIIGTHPLFGPQSGKDGIEGLNIVICPLRGNSSGAVRRFCRKQLGLRVFQTTAEEHDKEMAYVQGLTHLLSKVITELDLPPIRFTTKTFDLMQQMVRMVSRDSDELFRAIERENPYSEGAKRAFFSAAQRVEKRLTCG